MASSSAVDKGPQPTKRTQRQSNQALPALFTAAPEKLEPFLETLDKRQAYITHIDIHPGWFKRRVFAVPVALNVAIALLLGWRLYAALPWYISLVDGIVSRQGSVGAGLGQQFARADGRGGVDWARVVWTVAGRALLFALDYGLLTVVAPWPYSFFIERPANPMRWRTIVRFREQEVVVRVSRGWGAMELVGGSKKGGDSPFFRTRVAPNITREIWLKTGYLLMGRDWDLDFAAMIEAHALVDEDKFRLRDIDKRVFVFYPPPPPGAREIQGQWLVYNVPLPSGEVPADQVLDFEGTEEGKQKILEMKSRLAAMGKEELFFKWVQLVQEEAQRPGGFTKERQLETGLKVQALFEEEGVDWEQFAKDVGLPGAGEE